jgi:hypothetical protein
MTILHMLLSNEFSNAPGWSKHCRGLMAQSQSPSGLQGHISRGRLRAETLARLRFEVSRRIKEEFNNGKHYYALPGQPVRMPKRTEQHPDPAALS